MGNKPRRRLGVILAGGQSRRFGGMDKALALIEDRPLIAWVAARLAPQVDALAVCGGGRCYDGFEMLPEYAAGQGPLSGILAGLGAARSRGVEDLVTAPCDVPALPDNLVARLSEARERAGVLCAFARVAGRLNPVFGLYDVGLADRIRAAFAAGLRAPAGLSGLLPAASADFSGAQQFADIDTQDDLAAARIMPLP